MAVTISANYTAPFRSYHANITEGAHEKFMASNIDTFGSPIASVASMTITVITLEDTNVENLVTLSKSVIPRQKNISKLSTFESMFEEGYDSDGEAGPHCDLYMT